MSNRIKVALIGNPNTGKTSLFNQLTGLNQKVGNYQELLLIKNKEFLNYPMVKVQRLQICQVLIVSTQLL